MDRYAFEIFGVPVAWYAIIIGFAMILGAFILVKVGKKYGYKESDLLDLVNVVIPSAIVGARLYYVIFEWDYYSQDLSRILAFREGGLAIHGGIIGGLIGGYIVCKVKKLNFGELADMISMPLILGQAIGRWGNFVNGEAHGGPTTLPWGITVDGIKVHPTFLYESIWNVLVFGFLVITYKKRKFHGEHFVKYLMLYSVGRFVIEGMRTDSLMFLGMRVAQLLSAALVIGGAVFMIICRKKGWFAVEPKSETKDIAEK